MTPKVPAGADLKRSETGVSEKNLRCISGTSAFRISRYQHYWRRKTTFLSLLRTFLVVERNPLLKNCGFPPFVYLPFPLEGLAQTRDRRPLRKRERQSGYSYMTFSAFSQFTDTVLLHRRLNQRWMRHNNAAQLVYLDTTDSTCEFHLSVNS